MDNETKDLLTQIQADIKAINEKLDKIEKNQNNVANAENKNWHMLADKLGQYDLILHKLFGKKE
jgi:tetrahydromethanopterin S-methyltransferase subunit G